MLPGLLEPQGQRALLVVKAPPVKPVLLAQLAKSVLQVPMVRLERKV